MADVNTLEVARVLLEKGNDPTTIAETLKIDVAAVEALTAAGSGGAGAALRPVKSDEEIARELPDHLIRFSKPNDAEAEARRAMASSRPVAAPPAAAAPGRAAARASSAGDTVRDTKSEIQERAWAELIRRFDVDGRGPQRAGALALLEKGAVGSRWSKRWVVVDWKSSSVAYFATDKPPKNVSTSRSRGFELGDLTLRTQPSEVSAQAGKKANVSFQLLERSSKHLITFACATPQEVRAARAPCRARARANRVRARVPAHSCAAAARSSPSGCSSSTWSWRSTK